MNFRLFSKSLSSSQIAGERDTGFRSRPFTLRGVAIHPSIMINKWIFLNILASIKTRIWFKKMQSQKQQWLSWKRQNHDIANRTMRLALTALLSLAALIFVLASSANDNYTINIGGRAPPAEAGCHQVGLKRTDAGGLLRIYSCPA